MRDWELNQFWSFLSFFESYQKKGFWREILPYSVWRSRRDIFNDSIISYIEIPKNDVIAQGQR